MTINALPPGCFGSAILYRASAEECSMCGHAQGCARSVKEREETVLLTVGRFDRLFALERFQTVGKWFADRWKIKREDDTKRAKAIQLLASWKALGVNVYEIRHRSNPAPASEPHLRAGFAAVISNLAGFKRGDIVEEITARADLNLTKNGAKRFVDQICDALLEAGVLKTESRGILCLAS